MIIRDLIASGQIDEREIYRRLSGFVEMPPEEQGEEIRKAQGLILVMRFRFAPAWERNWQQVIEVLLMLKKITNQRFARLAVDVLQKNYQEWKEGEL